MSNTLLPYIADACDRDRGGCKACAHRRPSVLRCFSPTPQTLKEKLTGLGKDIQASDASDLAYEAIKASL
jgi:hypothetical protein